MFVLGEENVMYQNKSQVVERYKHSIYHVVSMGRHRGT